jgi:hypothetical protein
MTLAIAEKKAAKHKRPIYFEDMRKAKLKASAEININGLEGFKIETDLD